MCGRFTQIQRKAEMEQHFGIEVSSDEAEYFGVPRFNIAPSQSVPVVVGAVGAGQLRSFRLMRWGLVPAWSKSSRLGCNTINARVEGVEQSPVFRQAFQRSRCIVPVSGYYEWKVGTRPKQPYYIHASETESPLALAGLWDRWISPEGEAFDSFAILTTAANALLSRIHHRMPVVLPPACWAAWLGESPASTALLRDCMRPAPEQALEVYPVSPQVNRVRHDTPDNLVRWDPLEWDF